MNTNHVRNTLQYSEEQLIAAVSKLTMILVTSHNQIVKTKCFHMLEAICYARTHGGHDHHMYLSSICDDIVLMSLNNGEPILPKFDVTDVNFYMNNTLIHRGISKQPRKVITPSFMDGKIIGRDSVAA